MRSVVVIACLALLVGCSKQKTEAVAPTVYDAAAVEKRDIKVTVDAAGIIEPESIVEVKSQASGEVLNVHAEIGDVVNAKTMLVEIDKRNPRNKVSDTEASLTAAKARRTIAKTQLDRAGRCTSRRRSRKPTSRGAARVRTIRCLS
jgi:HlyD family secretion protein